MDVNVIVAGTAVAGVAATVVGLVVTVSGVRNQLWLQTYAEYTKRYGEILDALPFDARRPGSSFDIEALPIEDRQDRALRISPLPEPVLRRALAPQARPHRQGDMGDMV